MMADTTFTARAGALATTLMVAATLPFATPASANGAAAGSEVDTSYQLRVLLRDHCCATTRTRHERFPVVVTATATEAECRKLGQALVDTAYNRPDSSYECRVGDWELGATERGKVVLERLERLAHRIGHR